jgi:DNA-binding NtrC family response regulator
VLRDEVAAGRFREDLFFRLSVITIQLAPLRERREDVIPLARHFLASKSGDAPRTLTLSSEAEEALMAHRWPGNVRELENAIERAAVLARGDAITPEDLLLEQETGTARVPMRGTLQESIDQVVASRITAAIEDARGNRAEAARNLGIDRATLWRLMRRLAIR